MKIYLILLFIISVLVSIILLMSTIDILDSNITLTIVFVMYQLMSIILPFLIE